MAIIDWPDEITARPATVEWNQVVPEAASRSAFTQTVQTAIFGPAYWMVTVGIGPRRRDHVRYWEAFIAQLSNSNRVRFWDWRFETPFGSGAGTPLVNGAGQTGSNLITDGWTPSQSGVLGKGDWVGIGVNGELRRVVQQVDSNGAGQATLVLDQPLRSSPADNTALVLTKPKALFICTTEKASRGFILDNGRHRGPTLQFMEVFA